MKRLLPISFVICLSTVTTLGQTEAKLGIVLQSEQRSYSMKREIRLMIMRENRGQHDLLIPRQWGWGVMRTNIRIFDAKGHEVRTDFLADELPPPPQSYDFILLQPGEFVGTRMGGAAKEFVNAPG